MKRVLILQHLDADGPGYLRRWLEREGRAFELRNAERGDAFPPSIRGYAALAVLGGEMSANDPLPSLRGAERLILDAMAADVPVLGHCLGGQLMARALGAAVFVARAPEIGWHRIRVLPGEPARGWFGDVAEPTVFQWHYEAFELPAGAVSLARSEACTHQAFALGPHLAMQFHVELDGAKLAQWTGARDERWIAAAARSSVQTAAEMTAGAHAHLQAQQRLADRIYARWLAAARG